jgi:pilus assembly protein CpaF
MRPDRILIGECRGAEVVDMLQAMNTGHDGSLTTIHANSPRDALTRLEMMFMMAGMDIPLRAIREHVAAAVDLIIQVERMSGGVRRVTSLMEVVTPRKQPVPRPAEAASELPEPPTADRDAIFTHELFRFRSHGVDSCGKVHGEFEATGATPHFVTRFAERGITLPDELFTPRVLMAC